MNKQKTIGIITGFALIVFLLTDVFLFSSPSQGKKTLKEIYESGKITFVPELIISRHTFPDDVSVGMLTGLAVGEEFLYIPDLRMSEIKVLTTGGKYIRSFGQKGKGPSDLLRPFHAVISGTNLIVWESGNRRFSFFDSRGKFLKHATPRNTGNIVYLKVLDDGRFVAERNLWGFVNNKYTHHFGLELYSVDGELIKTLYHKQVYRRKYINNSRKNSVTLPFHPDYYWDILPGNKIVIGNSENYQLEIMDLTSGKSHTFTHTFTPVKVTERDKKDYLDRVLSSGPNGRPVKGAGTFRRNNTPFPAYKPAFKKIITDCDGNILVFKYKPDEDYGIHFSEAYFDAFDRSGKFIGEVEIESGDNLSIYSAMSKKENIFWVLAEDDEIESYIVKYRAK